MIVACILGLLESDTPSLCLFPVVRRVEVDVVGTDVFIDNTHQLVDLGHSAGGYHQIRCMNLRRRARSLGIVIMGESVTGYPRPPLPSIGRFGVSGWRPRESHIISPVSSCGRYPGQLLF